jgi:single-strand DNA-binding protein
MAFSLNKVQLIGVLGQDAETRFTQSNIPVTSFSIATTRSYKKDDKYENETTWHNIVAWNLSDFYQQVLKKGKKFYIEGRLQTRSYEDKEGIKRYVTEIVADSFNGIIPLEKNQNNEQNEMKPADKETAAMYAESEDLPF